MPELPLNLQRSTIAAQRNVRLKPDLARQQGVMDLGKGIVDLGLALGKKYQAHTSVSTQ